jgi:beta-glucosidase
MALDIPERAKEETVDTIETKNILRQVGAEGIVLCKNENKVLPFSKSKATAVIGPNAKFAAYSGGGSAKLAPYYAVTPYDGLSSQCESIQYGLGCIGYKKIPLLSSISRSPDGMSPGVEARIYLEPPETTNRKPIETMLLDNTDCFLDGWSHPMVNSALYWMEVEGIVTAEADGEYIFSLAVNGTAKLYVDGEEVVDNTTNQRPGDSFFGMGTAEEIGTVEVRRGQHYNVLVRYGTAPTSERFASSTQHGAGGLRIGCTRKTKPQELLAEAVALAKTVEQVVLCVGLNYEWESEGSDRSVIDLPPGTDELIAAVYKANKNIVVVNQSGTPVAMPWIDQVPAVLQAWFGGNETGNTIADVVFGDVNPSGKMPLSWPRRTEDNPAFLNYRSEKGKVQYGEGVYVGYRFYEMTKKDVLFPFGHGLSYSTFELDGLCLHDDGQDTLTFSVVVRNTGSVAGAEVVQLYVTQLSPAIQRPPQELKGFKKVHLNPGMSSVVEIQVSKKYACSYWDEEVRSFVMEEGMYHAKLGTSSVGEKLRTAFVVDKTVWWKGL